ncbi:MAG: methyl-accepting chemotaxis protein [Nostoc sp. DedSLP03]|uniref:HAMP domain-containing methyl-accepting chemotaxis protein n=1 Tax=Nostoc sp. DedSLP03 TaxID=3075400 RepID=UPI002AD23147|nr:methyl-accepting chemotaxis protein [Nostoc sp. DedSLP03]MDZ7968777.1 methyl-accepting chemotaxis protein [Nostoc sp. DedSLP03]
MLKNMSLRGRLMGSFLLMGGVVLVVGFFGWRGTHQLSSHIDTLSNNSLPSIDGLWRVNEGQTQIQSAERAILNPELPAAAKQSELNRMQAAWKQIDAGLEEYETTPRSPDEDKLYQTFKQQWQAWKQDHAAYLQAYQDFTRLGVVNPTARQLELTSQKRENSPEMKVAIAAADRLTQLRQNAVVKNDVSFATATNSLLQLIKINRDTAEDANKAASDDTRLTTGWVLTGIIAGPLGAILLGFFLAKPLTSKIAQIVQTMAASTNEIAAAVEQQERTATRQASSVNQTTITIDELGASSQQSAEQAESAVTGARQALTLAGNGADAVKRTLKGMETLQQKVAAIADHITRLNEQTKQIGSISGLVGELASQTNMLALNAAVEAVRAGEHGKGFAVVAAEIRKLADQSKKSTEKIGTLVGDIQSAISITVVVTHEGTKTVEEGTRIAQETSESFAGVEGAVNNIVINSQQISLNINQQAIAIQQIVSAMNDLNIAARETASGISQIRSGTQQLNESAQALKATI